MKNQSVVNVNDRIGIFNREFYAYQLEHNRVVISPDRWRLALGHRYNWYVEPIVFSHIQVAIRGLLMDYNVMLDDTNTTPESIKRILEVDPDAIAIPINTPVEICKERAIKSGQPDLSAVIDRMAINMSINYGKKFERLESVIDGIRTEVLSHSSRKVVV